MRKNWRSKKDIRALELSENAVPVKIIESFTKDGIRDACDSWKIKRDDVVLLKNSEGGGSQTALMIVQLELKQLLQWIKFLIPQKIYSKKI